MVVPFRGLEAQLHDKSSGKILRFSLKAVEIHENECRSFDTPSVQFYPVFIGSVCAGF